MSKQEEDLIFFIICGVALFSVLALIFYYVIKAAVKNATIEAHDLMLKRTIKRATHIPGSDEK